MRGDNEDSEQSVHNKTERGGPLNNAGRQSDSNVRRTLDHVEPTMGGVMTAVAHLVMTMTMTVACVLCCCSRLRHRPQLVLMCFHLSRPRAKRARLKHLLSSTSYFGVRLWAYIRVSAVLKEAALSAHRTRARQSAQPPGSSL